MKYTLSDYLEKVKSSITEAISDHHKYKADDYHVHSELDQETQDKIHEAMGGKLHTMINLGSGSSDPDPDVSEHLNGHGWKVHDYLKGTAKKTTQVGNPAKGIPMKDKEIVKGIGKILDETNAPDHVKTSYQNDPTRTKKDNSDLKVLISTHPYATIGKSTGTSWESCMNADSGSNNHYLEDDSAHGTHEAYLVHKDDLTANEGYPHNPLARISLKRFDSEDGNHTVFRPEPTAYGAAPSSMHHAVRDWAEKNYPARPGQSYFKHDNLYHDSGEKSFKALTDHDIADFIDHGHEKTTLSEKHQKIAMDHFAKPENNNKVKAHRISTSISNLSSEHVNALSDFHHEEIKKGGDTPYLQSLAALHGNKFSTNSINKYVDASGYKYIPKQLLSSRKLSSEIVDKIPTEDYDQVHPSLIKTHHIDKALTAYENNESGSAYPINALKNKFNASHMDRYVDHISKNTGSPINIENLINHPEFKDHHAEQILNSDRRETETAPILRNSPIVTKEHIDKNPYFRASEVLANSHLKPEVAKHAADLAVEGNLSRKIFREGSSKNLSDEHVKKIVDWHVNNENHYGATNIHDEHLSNRVLDEFHNRLTHATKEHEEINYDEHDKEQHVYDDSHDKLERLHIAHNEALSNHFTNNFGDLDEEENHYHPGIGKFMNRIDHWNDNPVRFEYDNPLKY